MGASNSEYFRSSFYVAAGASLAVSIIFILAAALLLFNVSKNSSRVVAFVVAALITVAQMFVTIFFALVSGYGFIPAWASFLISSLLWIPTVMFGMTMLGSAWRSAFLITSVMKKETSGTTISGAVGGCMYALRSLVSGVVVVAIRQPFLYWISSVAAFIFTLCTVLILYGVCFCTNPSQISTWASRRNEAKFCIPNEVCHVYSLVGINASRLRIVGHYQSSDGSPPASVSVAACASNALTKACVGPRWLLPTRLLNLADSSEDYRFVVHGLASNLSGSAVYKFDVSFTPALTSGSPTTTKSIVVTTVPDPDSEETYSFLAGGDYHSSTLGVEMLAAGIAASDHPRFLLVGGDISYANNLRTCYLRWDRVLHSLSTLVTAEGLHVPLLTAVGNHESGGYLVESSRSDYLFYTQYLPQYDEDTPSDTTVTYHSHFLGKRFGLITLDSNCMMAVEDQKEYLKKMIVAMRGIDSSDAGQTLTTGIIDRMRFVTVAFHNPAFPVLESFDDSSPQDPTPLLLKHWLPIMEQQRVPLVLEFHEHVYKRSKPLNKQIAAPPGDGIVFLGDGALGVFKGRKISSVDFVEVTASTNYINTVTVFGRNGTVAVDSIFVPDAGNPSRGDGVTLSRRL